MTGNRELKPPPDPAGDLPTETELWYLECLRRWTKAYGRAPVIRELALFCKKSPTAVASALYALEYKRYVDRVGGEGRQGRRFKIMAGR